VPVVGAASRPTATPSNYAVLLIVAVPAALLVIAVTG
jgi:hypothetical protein